MAMLRAFGEVRDISYIKERGSDDGKGYIILLKNSVHVGSTVLLYTLYLSFIAVQ